MNIRNIAIIVFALLVPLTVQAQKKKKVIKKQPPVVVVEEPQEDPRITEMREATQQIMFIDSLVVDKEGLLSFIMLHPESGRLMTYDQFFHSEGHSGSYTFVNEMGNKCYFSDEDDNGRMTLYTSDKLGKEWSEPTLLQGIINKGITEANYPFMMTDGTTFYFAAKGQESIGGYDIFVTRYDSEDGRFLRPENIGMPFNSEANDYMYVIDEQNNIGIFVTDRRQPEGKVCVYVFIPPTSRQTYNLDKYSDEQLRSLSEIHRIADTWGNGKERKQALERLRNTPQKVDQQTKAELNFVINDNVTYTSVSQFRSPESLPLYKKLTDAQKQLEETKKDLEKSRNFYVKAKAEDKRVLRTEILDGEDEIFRLTYEVNELEKRIRNAENIIINQKNKSPMSKRTFPESELIINADGSCFHLHLKPEQLADKVVLVGDPARVDTVAAHFDSKECEVSSREFHTITGMYKGKRITVQSHGIGCDNIDIVANELDTLANIDYTTREEKAEHRTLTMVRIGTCGGLQPYTPTGCFVASVKSIGFDGLLNYYAGRNKVCDLQLEEAFKQHMQWDPIKGAPYVSVADADLINQIAQDDMVKGYTISCGGFYGPQGRVLRADIADPLQNQKIESFEYDGMNICNFEMESSALAGLASLLGHRAMTCCMVIANRYAQKMNTEYKNSIDTLIEKVLDRI